MGGEIRRTSLEMLDRHYGRWMGDEAGQLALLTDTPQAPPDALARRAGGRRTGTFPEPFARLRKCATQHAKGGRFEPVHADDE